MAPFLDNHDTDRIAQVIGVYAPERLKAAYGMLAMMRGGTYVYYGGEIGMVGSGPDPNKRLGMFWTSLPEVTVCPPGTTQAQYPMGSVTQQQEEENSLLHYVRKAMNLRNAFPGIARGTSELLDSGDGDLCVLRRSTSDSSLTIVLNLSDVQKSLPLPAEDLLAELDADLTHGEGITYQNGTLTLDPWGIAVLK